MGEALASYFVALKQKAELDPSGQRFSGLKPSPKARLGALLTRLGPSNAQTGVRERVAGLAKGLVVEVLAQANRITCQAVEQYRVIDSDAPDEAREVAHSMVVHQDGTRRIQGRKLL
jgi:hypothetical protein